MHQEDVGDIQGAVAALDHLRGARQSEVEAQSAVQESNRGLLLAVLSGALDEGSLEELGFVERVKEQRRQTRE